MSGLEKISQAILEKVKMEADNIIKDADTKAHDETDKARKQQASRLIEQKQKIINDAKEEASRILAQASIKARQELLTAKTGVIEDIVTRVRKQFYEVRASPVTIGLIKETLRVITADKIVVYVSPRDLASTRSLIEKDKALANRIAEVKEIDRPGGVVVEDLLGKIRVDNTYGTRLEMLLPRLLPEISKSLFEKS